MKKIVFISIATCIVVMAGITPIYAQQSIYAFAFNQYSLASAKIIATTWNDRSVMAIPSYKVSIKAVRDFAQSFKDAENVRWYKVAGGTVVYFSDKGTERRSSYDERGHWLYSISSYAEEHLPKRQVSQVRSIYYDFTINSITEVNTDDKIIYMVYLEGKDKWKTIRLSEDDMEEVDELLKYR
jgi:hypothetical protein